MLKNKDIKDVEFSIFNILWKDNDSLEDLNKFEFVKVFFYL